MAGEKGIRICGTKVRTGCLTCKSRRIKCDETKPFCRKCTSARRTCSGYAQDPKTLSMVIYRAPSISLVTTELERRSFAFFLDQTRNLFPIGFSNPLLQAAHENRALAHSVISLGALQQHFEHGDGPRLNISLGLLAAQQYGKALRALQSHNEPPSVDTLMICSIVFACFECLRGCRQAAIIHMKSGLDLFRRSGAYAAWNIVSEKTMGLLLIRWENQLIEMLGLDIRNDQSPPLAGLYFDDVNNFHSSLDGIINHILHAKHNLSVFEEHQTPWASPGRFSQISSTIEEWHHGFLISTSQQKKQRQQQLSEDSEGHGQDDPILLHIWYLLSKIYIAIQPAVDAEEAWDQFTGDFDTIVALSESYLSQSRNKHTRKRTFTLSLGVIPPLFLASTRCRNTHIRRRALQQLIECNRTELIWDSVIVAKVAKYIIDIEEPSFHPKKVEKRSHRPRIRSLTVSFDDESGEKFQFFQG